MDDLISRQNLIVDLTVTAEETAQMKAGDLKKVINVINNQQSAQQWIPCSERLPEEEKDVLACTESGELLVAYVFNDWGNRWVWTTGALGSGSVDVVAWMPLPEPYKENNHDR